MSIIKTYTLACKDLGMDCPFSVTSDDKEETKEVASAHAQKRHAEKMSSMSEEEQKGMAAQMDSAISEMES